MIFICTYDNSNQSVRSSNLKFKTAPSMRVRICTPVHASNSPLRALASLWPHTHLHTCSLKSAAITCAPTPLELPTHLPTRNQAFTHTA